MSATSKILPLLQEKKAQLEAEMTRISAPPDDASGISFGKRVGEGTSYAVDRLVNVAFHDQLVETLADVERALVKVEEGTYGICDGCSMAISPARLEFVPWVALCVTCASKR